MQLIADRFIGPAEAQEGPAIDLATNRSVWLRVLPRSDDDVHRRWALNCDELFRAQLEDANSLVDYGMIGMATRFEAWSSAKAAAQVDAAPQRAIGGVSDSIADHPAIAAVGELFRSVDSRRGAAVALHAPTRSRLAAAVHVLARAARLNGFIPVAGPAFAAYATFIRSRSLFVIDDGSVMMPSVRVVLSNPCAHVCLSVGTEEPLGVHSVSLGVVRSGGCVRNTDRGSGAPLRVAERPASYTVDRPGPTLFPHPGSTPEPERLPSPAATAELTALWRRVERSDAMLAAGRRAPGLRLLRQAVGGLARRQAWTDATRGALTLAGELMKRGRPRETLRILSDATRYAEQASDGGALLDCALLTGQCWVDAARLDEAERVFTTGLTSARVAGDRLRQLALSIGLARCLFWRAEYAAAAACLETEPDFSLPDATAIRRLRMVARISVARGDCASAIAALDECHRRAPVGVPELQAGIEATCGFVKLVIGDYDAVDHHVARSVVASRQARHPLRMLSARLLQAEADRRRSRKLTEGAVRALRRTSATAPPILRARWDLLVALEGGTDVPAVTARQMAVSGLKALELFAGVNRSGVSVGLDPIVGDVVAILQVCQQADDERALVHEVCVRVRQRLRAAGSALIVPGARGCMTIAADGARIEPEIAQRTFGLGTTVKPARVRERIEAAAIVEYGGKAIGALCARWSIGTTEDLSRAAPVLSMAAVAASPLVAAFLARQAQPAVMPGVDFLGVTPRIVDLRREIERAAAAPFAVLIQGESGSGKELVARAIHRAGPRRDRAFSTLNCAALPDDLVEAELFGHARGAFTGAIADRPGVFEDAHGGTLFLDEVGELSARAQAKVLRVIQEGELRRVGENISRRVDVRIVAATNRDLQHEADAGRFRVDLLYRLDVIRVAVPPLRERPEDIAVLIDHFWDESTRRIGSRATLAAPTRSALTQYAWPGNVRELQNVLAALAVRSPKRGLVPPSALPPHLATMTSLDSRRLHTARRTFEESFIRAALVRTGGHRGRAAEDLGLSRQGLTKLMARLGIA